MHLLYFHGSSLRAFRATGKAEFTTALNPRGLFDTVHMVNIDTRADEDEEWEVPRIRFSSIGLGGDRNPVARLRHLDSSLRKLVGEQRPSIVCADDANLLGASAWITARRAGAPYAIWVYYENDLHFRLTGRPALAFLRSRRLEKRLEAFVFRGATGVYAGNRGYRDYALRHGADPETTYLGNWSVDDIFYEPRPAPHADSREVLMVARLHHLKFIDDVMRALLLLPSELRLDVAGEGPNRPELEQLVGQLGLQTRVRFLGVVHRTELLRRMQGARTLVVTQGFNALVESLLSGRPVVAYDHECNSELARPGDTAFLVPFRDVEALAGAILRVWHHPSEANTIAERGRAEMLQEQTIDKSIENRYRFLRSCLEAWPLRHSALTIGTRASGR